MLWPWIMDIESVIGVGGVCILLGLCSFYVAEGIARVKGVIVAWYESAFLKEEPTPEHVQIVEAASRRFFEMPTEQLMAKYQELVGEYRRLRETSVSSDAVLANLGGIIEHMSRALSGGVTQEKYNEAARYELERKIESQVTSSVLARLEKHLEVTNATRSLE